MPNKIFIFGVTVLAIVIIVGGASWSFLNTNQSLPSDNSQDSQTNQNPTNTTDNQNTEIPSNSNTTDQDSQYSNSTEMTLMVEEIRDKAMTYIKNSHPKTAQYMDNLVWLGGRSDVESSENETYVYYASDWAATLQWEPISNPLIHLVISYNSETITMAWEGTYQNNTIKQTSYSGNL